jgi:hypothetical protein
MGLNISGIVQIINVLAKFIPPPSAPKADYSELMKALPDYSKMLPAGAPVVFQEGPRPSANPQVLTIDASPKKVERKEVATSCLACSRSHLTTVAGALDEAMRFARKEGVSSPEVIERIDTAEREINIMERLDLSPEKIQNSPKEEQDFIRPFMNTIRELRQNIGLIRSVDQLEKVAADANVVSREFKSAQMNLDGGKDIVEAPHYEVKEPEDDHVKVMEARLRRMQANGVNLNPVIQLAKDVQAGRISLEDAREKVRQLLPEE